MDYNLKDIKSVGFDLDNTLYPNRREIDDRIKKAFSEKILERVPGLGNLENSIVFYESKYREMGSIVKILGSLGFDNPREISYKCMLKADIQSLIKEDSDLAILIGNLKSRYSIFLITNSPEDIALKIIENLGIDYKLFDYFISGSNKEAGNKIDGSMFRYFLSFSKNKPNEHIYVGDSLKSDILPAKSVGMKTISVGNIKEADFCVKKIHEISHLLL